MHDASRASLEASPVRERADSNTGSHFVSDVAIRFAIEDAHAAKKLARVLSAARSRSVSAVQLVRDGKAGA